MRKTTFKIIPISPLLRGGALVFGPLPSGFFMKG